VVELFTSQGCSSCPAADQLLGELSHDPSIITMSLPIDYGTTSAGRTRLLYRGTRSANGPMRTLSAIAGVYTPQAVVNGSVQVVGSERAAIEGAIDQSHKHTEALTLPVSLSVVDGQIKIVTAESTTPHSGEVWLCSLSKAVPVVIGRGENHGRTINLPQCCAPLDQARGMDRIRRDLEHSAQGR